MNTADSSSGGGCSDIRLKNGTDFESLKSRIIVSSGSAGAISFYEVYSNGASGGILSGFNGKRIFTSSENSVTISEGGQLDRGGSASNGTHVTGDKSKGFPGEFGKGGDVRKGGVYGSGGGCGYFGGGAGNDGTDTVTSGAGGLSYVSGYNGFMTIDETSKSSSEYRMLQTSFHPSGLYFTDVKVKDYLSEFSSPNGYKETGHTGHGAIAITLLYTVQFSCNFFYSFQHFSYFSIVILFQK